MRINKWLNNGFTSTVLSDCCQFFHCCFLLYLRSENDHVIFFLKIPNKYVHKKSKKVDQLLIVFCFWIFNCCIKKTWMVEHLTEQSLLSTADITWAPSFIFFNNSIWSIIIKRILIVRCILGAFLVLWLFDFFWVDDYRIKSFVWFTSGAIIDDFVQSFKTGNVAPINWNAFSGSLSGVTVKYQK